MQTFYCKSCRKQFKSYRKTAIFCSKKCSNSYNAKKKSDIVCLECNMLFHAKGTKQRFCSHNCWMNYKTRNKIGLWGGYKWTDEHKKKQSIRVKEYFKTHKHYSKGKKLPNRSGKNHPLWGKVRPDMRGKNNPLWKGGVAVINRGIRLSYDYSHWRKEVFNRDDFTCQECGVRGVFLHAHHIKSFAEHSALRLEVDNGITLCKECHTMIHSKKKLIKIGGILF